MIYWLVLKNKIEGVENSLFICHFYIVDPERRTYGSFKVSTLSATGHNHADGITVALEARRIESFTIHRAERLFKVGPRAWLPWVCNSSYTYDALAAENIRAVEGLEIVRVHLEENSIDIGGVSAGGVDSFVTIRKFCSSFVFVPTRELQGFAFDNLESEACSLERSQHSFVEIECANKQIAGGDGHRRTCQHTESTCAPRHELCR